MERVVRSTFPGMRVERNARDLGLVSELGNKMEVDCYIPELKLGFEFNVCLSPYIICLLTIRRNNIITFTIHMPNRCLYLIFKLETA